MSGMRRGKSIFSSKDSICSSWTIDIEKTTLRGITSFMQLLSKEKCREYERAVAAGAVDVADSIFKEACLSYFLKTGDIPECLAVEPPKTREDRKAIAMAVLNLQDGRIGTGRFHAEAYKAAGIEIGEGDGPLGDLAASPGLQGFVTNSGHFSDGLRYFEVTSDGELDMPGITASGDKTLTDRFAPALPGRFPVCVFSPAAAKTIR